MKYVIGAWLLIMYMMLVNVLTQWGANDVRKVCAAHNAVASVVDTTWTAGAGRATVVCRDGWVGQLR